MVKKLFKHEFLAFARVMSIVYIILLAVATAGRVIQFFENDSIAYSIVWVITCITYGVTIFSALLGGFVFTLTRFYKNMFTSEGYLTLTLPVTPAQHIWVKSITSVYFSVITVLVIFLSSCIISAGEVLVEFFKAAGYLLKQLYAQLGYQMILAGLEIVALLLVSALFSVLLYDMFITIGQLFKKNRVLAAVGAYFVYYLFTQIVSSVFLSGFASLAGSPLLQQLDAWSTAHPFATWHIILCTGIVVLAVFNLICFLVIRHIIAKKINLE